MEISIKIGTHSLQTVRVCRKRRLPEAGEIIAIKRCVGAKEERIRILELSPHGHYFGEFP